MKCGKQDTIYNEVRSLVNLSCSDKIAQSPGACLYWADAGAKVLRKHGYKRAQIQAGTASWLIVPERLDDGVSPNRFTYKWTGENIIGNLLKEQLPEMHCWVADPDSQTIMDFSLGTQPKNCELLTGMKWHEELIPKKDYFWGCFAECLGLDYIYQADRDAIELCYKLLGKL